MGKLCYGLDLAKEEDRAAYLKKAVVFLAQIRSSLERAVYISKAADTARVPADTVRYAVESEISRQKKKSDRDEYRSLISPRNTDKVNPEAAKLPREEKAERGIICYVFQNPDKASPQCAESCPAASPRISTGACSNLWNKSIIPGRILPVQCSTRLSPPRKSGEYTAR